MQQATLRAALAGPLFLILTATSVSAQCTDDYLENNDTCATPTLVYDGFSATLTSLYGDDDYYQIYVPDGSDLTIDLTFSHSLGDLDLHLWDYGCTTQLAGSTSITDDESVTWSNSSGYGMDVVARVTMYAPNPDILCNDYDASFSVSTVINCQDDNETGNKDNDTCADANLIFSDALYINMGVLDTDPDYYKITVPAGDTLYVDLTFTHLLGDIDLRLLDSSCNSTLATANTSTDDESLSWTNTGAWDVEVKWHVYLYSGTCNQYHMVASLVPPDCGSEDIYEENDTCAQARPMGFGTYPGLLVQDVDPDFYSFPVNMGEALQIDVFFQHANGDIDLRLWDYCGGSLIASSGTVGDHEYLAWNNHTLPSTTVFLEVYLHSGTCNNYELSASITNVPPGTNHCVALPNSTGYPALMSGVGTRSIAANNLTLIAGPVPTYQFAIFYYGVNPIQIPFGNGYRCVGGAIYRLPVVNSGGSGVLSFALDHTNLPFGGGIAAGTGRYFQAWYRDPAAGGAMFNLSDSYLVNFIP